MLRFLLLAAAVLVFIGAIHVCVQAQDKPLVAEWVNNDLEGVSAVRQLIPFEKQNIQVVKARLRKDWSIEETNLGFGGLYLTLAKGQGYAKSYVYALIYEGRVAMYEAGIESYSDEWPKIRERVLEKWEAEDLPQVALGEHGIAYKRTLESIMHLYQARVASALGPTRDASVAPDLEKSYASLTDPMNNSTISMTRRDEEIGTLLNANRTDLLENVLKAYNPGARVLAALALLELQKGGTRLSRVISKAIVRVLNLKVNLHACMFDICSYLTAKEAINWFDSDLAFPVPKVRRRS